MDIAGWVKLSYKIDFSKYDTIYQDTNERDAAKKRAVAIILKNIDKRISSLWVSDYVARQQIINGENFVVIEIGGIYSLDVAKSIIGKTVELEFKVPSELWENQSELIAQRATLAKEMFSKIKKNPETINEAVIGKEWEEIYGQVFSGTDIDSLPLVYENNREKLLNAKAWAILDFGLWDYIQSSDPSSSGSIAIRWYTLVIVDNIQTVKNTPATGDYISWSLSPSFKAETTRLTGKEIFITEKPTWIVATDPNTKEILNGAFFSYASTSVGQTGKPVVTITFNDKWKELFCNLTKVYVNKQMAIFVGGSLMTAPTINEPICQWQAQIDGQFTASSARELSEWLNEWALPAPLVLSQEEKISAVLWDNAMQWAIIAAWVSLVLIFIMLLFFYEWKIALLWFVVLISYAIYILAVFKIIDYAFSLSGIAAIILSLGMGIDANILIFERLREELQSGKPWINAVETAYQRSRAAILDGNMTTMLIFLVLFFMGMSIFKWFWFAGIITSGLILIAIVPLTKTLLMNLKK